MPVCEQATTRNWSLNLWPEGNIRPAGTTARGQHVRLGRRYCNRNILWSLLELHSQSNWIDSTLVIPLWGCVGRRVGPPSPCHLIREEPTWSCVVRSLWCLSRLPLGLVAAGFRFPSCPGGVPGSRFRAGRGRGTEPTPDRKLSTGWDTQRGQMSAEKQRGGHSCSGSRRDGQGLTSESRPPTLHSLFTSVDSTWGKPFEYSVTFC